MMLQETVVTDKPPARVFDYLSDFTSTTDWDPGTVTTVRQDGDGGVGPVCRPAVPARADPARRPGRDGAEPGAGPALTALPLRRH
jgi:hypothetical protein